MAQPARDYDLGIVINPDVGDEQARALVERVTQAIAAHDGQVIRVNAVGRRRLAYPVQHHRDGLYFFFDLTLPPTAVVEVERSLHVNEDIIRHLLLLRDPRVVTQQRQREAEAEAQATRERAEAPEEARAVAEEPVSAEAASELAVTAADDEEGEGDEEAEEATSEAEANA